MSSNDKVQASELLNQRLRGSDEDVERHAMFWFTNKCLKVVLTLFECEGIWVQKMPSPYNAILFGTQ